MGVENGKVTVLLLFNPAPQFISRLRLATRALGVATAFPFKLSESGLHHNSHASSVGVIVRKIALRWISAMGGRQSQYFFHP